MSLDHRLSVAPMLDWTDRHCRYFHRLISSEIVVYTEMITTGALLHGDRTDLLTYHNKEHPVVIQLGGSDPNDLAVCAKMAEDAGYDEVNINIGCPSDRVQSGRFGACLMREPELVADCVQHMQQAVSIPITLKTRIGVDDDADYDFFKRFVTINRDAGCRTFIVHARKALLKGLSPKQNRSIPPLQYHFPEQIKADFPDLTVVVNGGIDTVQKAQNHLQYADGVMIGRAFWNAPWLIRDMHHALGFKPLETNRDDVLNAYQDYCVQMMAQGLNLHWLIRPILGLFHGFPGSKKWKSYLVTEAPKRKDDIRVLNEARSIVNYVSEIHS
jgi:tRNA-dihydrouridine synthase A